MNKQTIINLPVVDQDTKIGTHYRSYFTTVTFCLEKSCKTCIERQ